MISGAIVCKRADESHFLPPAACRDPFLHLLYFLLPPLNFWIMAAKRGFLALSAGLSRDIDVD